jgi:hypothetical protein
MTYQTKIRPHPSPLLASTNNTLTCASVMLGRYLFVIGSGNTVLVLNEVLVSVGNQDCSACPSFSTSIIRATSVTACTCLPGYINTTAANAPVNCTACPANTYYIDNQGIACPSNTTYAAGSVSCHCKAGFTGTPDACQACPAGTYKRMAGTSPCRSCQANSRSDALSSYCSTLSHFVFLSLTHSQTLLLPAMIDHLRLLQRRCAC